MGIAPLVAAWGRRFPRSLAGPLGPTPSGRSPVDFGNGALLRVNAFLALGADLTADPATWTWTKIPQNLIRQDDGNGIAVSSGRSDASSSVSPGWATLMVDNQDGRFTRSNATSPYYPYLTRNTPILVQVDAGNQAYNLVEMFVHEFPMRWDKSGTDCWMPLLCGGVMRRLNRGKSPLKSQLRRGLEAGFTAVGGQPFAYYPMEDGPESIRFVSPITGINPGTMNDLVAPGAADMTGLGGSYPLAVLSTGANVNLTPAMPTASTEWTFQFIANVRYTDSSTDELIRWETPGGYPGIWRLLMVPSAGGYINIRLEGLEGDGTAIGAFNLTRSYVNNLLECVNRWCMIEVSAEQVGANIVYSYIFSRGEDTTASGSAEITTAGTLKGISSVKVSSLPAGLNGTELGHVLVRTNAWGYFQLRDDELMGTRPETAVDRLGRVCEEAGVPLVVASGVAESVEMGPQSPGKLMEVLRECEDADGGVLYEKGFGLYYQPLSARYNRPVDLRLDFGQGHINGEPQPVDDDQGFCNSFTVTRTGAESVEARDEDSITDVGLYENSATVNTFTPDLAAQVGTWRMHLGQDDGQRWPQLQLRFDNTAGRGLIPAWEELPPGARVTIDNPPEQVALDTIDVFLEGRQERATETEWEATFNATAAAPYRVFVLDDSVLGKLDSDGSTLSAGSSSAKSEGTSLTPDYILIGDWAAAPFGIGDKIQLFYEDGVRLKETTVFTITSKPSAFGFTEIRFTPNAAENPVGLYLGTGELIKHVSETTFLVATTTAGSPLWTTTATEFPFDILVGGERMTVTGISGASSPQTFTVTRSVNGVVKSHLAGTDVIADFAVLAK